jgi:hypothetical protein
MKFNAIKFPFTGYLFLIIHQLQVNTFKTAESFCKEKVKVSGTNMSLASFPEYYDMATVFNTIQLTGLAKDLVFWTSAWNVRGVIAWADRSPVNNATFCKPEPNGKEGLVIKMKSNTVCLSDPDPGSSAYPLCSSS